MIFFFSLSLSSSDLSNNSIGCLNGEIFKGLSSLIKLYVAFVMTTSSLRLLQRLEGALLHALCLLSQKPFGEHFLLADSGKLRRLGVTEVAVSHRRYTRGMREVGVVFCGRLLKALSLVPAGISRRRTYCVTATCCGCCGGSKRGTLPSRTQSAPSRSPCRASSSPPSGRSSSPAVGTAKK